MKIAPELTLLLLAFFFISLHSSSLVASDSKISSSDDSSRIGIDCGAEEEYQDRESNIWYKPDSEFVETGKNHKLPPGFSFSKPQMSKQLNTLRSFPDGERNCYTLPTKQGRNKTYIVRAFFAYGNYDLTNTKPIFDLYLGVNRWKTIDFDNITTYYSVEVILFALTDTISVCLVNTGKGVPFISSLELWLLGDSMYTISGSLSLDLLTRSTPGRPGDDRFIRFEDDPYGRVWFKRHFDNSISVITTPVAIDLNGTQNSNKLPKQALKTAIESLSPHSSMEIYDDQQTDSSDEYFCYFYFFEFNQQATTQKRIMDITLNDKSILAEPLSTQHLKLSEFHNITQVNHLRILIKPTAESDLPAMINAFEVYRGLKLANSGTAQEDVDAIRGIKSIYNIIKWQGDPCIPAGHAWEGVSCTSDASPKVTSLNLSSRGLTGKIDASFSKFTKLRSLDLSYNKLTGEVPEYFAQLPDLEVLNLTGNQLTGSIPKSLWLKSYGSLSLSLEGNPGLCLAKSCEAKKHATLLIACIAAASIVVLALTVLIYLMNMRIKRKKQRGFKKDGREKSKKQVFSLKEVTRITSNFKTVIGKGGFGEVYLGTLQDGREVAVKLLSQTSRQGYREFHSEADLLTYVHHKNLVSFVGYCEEGDVKALIYEYMAKGNLQQLLSDKNSTVLKWFERLQIAVDVALGLDYLHYGIRPPIVHRDLKTSNILLNENMQAKISDFGLCRSFVNEHDSHISTIPAGTLGYLDPEFRGSGKLNRKCDVYSFGIILLELISGQPAMKEVSLGIKIQLLDWVNPKLNNGDIESIVDPRLEGQYNKISAWKLVEIAMSCTQPSAIQRPDISEVLTELKVCLASEITHESSESSMRWCGDNSSSGVNWRITQIMEICKGV